MNNEYTELPETEALPEKENNASSEEEPKKEYVENSDETALLEEKIGELEAALLKEQIKVKLLILGIIPEKLEDGAAMAYGLCLAGKTPDEAADEIITAYPHLKAVRREIPQFSTESAGSGDGFSMIRKIFSTR